MKVLANQHLYKFRKLLPDTVDLHLFDPAHLPDNTPEYDALFVNTTTPINSETLPEPGNLKFIATGSSGTDHLDLDYLTSKQVKTADAAGCNAATVAEYVITSILCLQQKTGVPLTDFTVGIIGVGHVGTEVSRMLTRFSIPHISYDPPRADRDTDFYTAHFDELKTCNILTFHTPLTYSGSYPTHHLLNRSWFRGAEYRLLINTSRGDVIDEKLILAELESGRLSSAVIDVWHNEPRFNPDLASRALFATPHIAGYSVQSKIRASEMIIRQFCDYMGIDRPKPFEQQKQFVDLKGDYSSLSQILLDLHPINRYSRQLKKALDLPDKQRTRTFISLRSGTSLRHEFSQLQISGHYLDHFPELNLLRIDPK